MDGRIGFCRGVWTAPAARVCTGVVSAGTVGATVSAGADVSAAGLPAVAEAVVSAGIRFPFPEQAQTINSPERSGAVIIKGFHSSM
jgi:hypothetical protein